MSKRLHPTLQMPKGNYTFEFKYKITPILYEYPLSDLLLRDGYYMELHDEVDLHADSDGGTHPNPEKRTSICYFSIAVSKGLSNQRTIFHESLHPILDHTFAGGPLNPLYNIYTNFFELVKSTIIKLVESKPANVTVLQYRRTIGIFIRNLIQNNDYIKEQATIIRENMMTTAAINKSDQAIYSEYVLYLLDYLKPNEQYETIDKGKKINSLQIKHIVEMIPGK
jgi:hypothetical protein